MGSRQLPDQPSLTMKFSLSPAWPWLSLKPTLLSSTPTLDMDTRTPLFTKPRESTPTQPIYPQTTTTSTERETPKPTLNCSSNILWPPTRPTRPPWPSLSSTTALSTHLSSTTTLSTHLS